MRDYVHVVDIAKAHISALEKIDDLCGNAYNLGSGSGYSVLSVLEAAKKVTGIDIPVQFVDRRPGDPAVLVASNEKAKNQLSWEPKLQDIGCIVEDAWRWHVKYPSGYDN